MSSKANLTVAISELMTHSSKSYRQLGSIGSGTTPGRVYKGKKMPGIMGGTKIRKLKIIKIDKDLDIVMVKRAVPGKPGNLRIAPAKIVGHNIPKNCAIFYRISAL